MRKHLWKNINEKKIAEKMKEVFDFSFFIVFLQKNQLIHEKRIWKNTLVDKEKVLTKNNSL